MHVDLILIQSVLKFTFSFFSGFAYGGLDFSRRDLMAINIQRGRDHGLSDYNTARRHYGLQPKSDFLDIKANESNIPDKVCVAMSYGTCSEDFGVVGGGGGGRGGRAVRVKLPD